MNAYLIDRCGLKPATSEQIGLVVSSYCDFFGSIAYPAVVDLGLRVLKLGRSSVLYEVGVFEQGHDAVRAVGGFVHVFVEQNGRRPAKEGMDATIRDGLAQILAKKDTKL